MDWLNRHLNWAYLLGILIICALAFLSAFAIEILNPIADADDADPSYGLRIYLDAEYSKEWEGENILDLENALWLENNDGWYSNETVVYLENIGGETLIVYVSSTENPQYAIPGFSVSSDRCLLEPREKQPITLCFRQSSWYGGTPQIWWQIEPQLYIESDTGEWVYIILSSIALLFLTAWILQKKGRSWGWLFLSLSYIAPIVVLCLSNKRKTKEPDCGDCFPSIGIPKKEMKILSQPQNASKQELLANLYDNGVSEESKQNIREELIRRGSSS